MKMRKSEHFVRSSSSISGQLFSVAMSDKLFETLYSNLYKYKEAAVLRETLCNAIDSHEMRDRLHNFVASHYQSVLQAPQQRFSRFIAPKGTNVVVHLPDVLEPWLEIRDYGIGLSLEQIIGHPILAKDDEVLIEGNIVVKEDEIPENSAVIGIPDFYGDKLVFRAENGEIIRSPGLYTTLFRSTKEDDNSQVGAFGLGSKSPFSVSDSFTVEARYEGQVHRFLMYLNAERMPAVDLITKDLETRDPLPEPTEEYNGVTVRVPIKNSRFRAYQDELLRLGMVMRPSMRPEVENSDYYFEWKNIDFENRVNNTYIQPKSEGSTHYAVMGGVSYPIDLSQLDAEIFTVMSKFPTSYTYFELGELNVPPSREDLTYDQFSRETLNRTFLAVSKSIMEAKMRELRMAQDRGPLALYLQKSRLTEMFGSGFRKMMEREFPVDNRFHENYFRPGKPIEIERNFDENAPFHKIEAPYSLDVYGKGFGESTMLSVSYLAYLRDKGSKVVLLIDNTSKARNLRVATARKYNENLIVVSPNTSYLVQRNQSKDCPAFVNAKEVHEYLSSWIGNEETKIDYLAFADKVEETFSPVMDIEKVVFMDELEYEKPTVEKDPGMFYYDGRVDFDPHYELSSQQISEIIDSGKRIVYVEVSGRSLIHTIMGKTVTPEMLRNIEGALDNAYMDKETVMESMNCFKHFILARRKSVPMMKKFPEVFIPLDKMFEILLERNMEPLKYTITKDMLKIRRNMTIRYDRLGYGTSLLNMAFGEVKSDYSTAVSRFRRCINYIDQLLTPEEKKEMMKIVNAGNKQDYHSRREFTLFRKLISAAKFEIHTTEIEKQIYRVLTLSTKIFQQASVILEGQEFGALSQNSTIPKSVRKRNRLTVEKYKVIRFLKENYTPEMHNPSEDPNEFLKFISTRILR